MSLKNKKNKEPCNHFIGHFAKCPKASTLNPFTHYLCVWVLFFPKNSYWLDQTEKSRYLMFRNDEPDLNKRLILVRRLIVRKTIHLLCVLPAGSGLHSAVRGLPDSVGASPAATQPGQGGSRRKQPFARERVLQRSACAGDL